MPQLAMQRVSNPAHQLSAIRNSEWEAVFQVSGRHISVAFHHHRSLVRNLGEAFFITYCGDLYRCVGVPIAAIKMLINVAFSLWTRNLERSKAVRAKEDRARECSENRRHFCFSYSSWSAGAIAEQPGRRPVRCASADPERTSLRKPVRARCFEKQVSPNSHLDDI
jgi:hypothetical protein